MSARRRLRLIIQPAAELDIDDALVYTRDQWGFEQRDRFAAQLNRTLKALFDYPDRGRVRDELYTGCRSIVFVQYRVFYHPTDDQVVIDRFVHSSRDIADLIGT
jgi:toxin ParE1/3/4